MRQTLHRRLQQLEVHSARVEAALRGREVTCSSALEKFHFFLKMRGIEVGPAESVAEASCRALEITTQELRRMLSQGIDPIHRYFVEHGVFEEIEKRKAAGTWPSGEREWNDVMA